MPGSADSKLRNPEFTQRRASLRRSLVLLVFVVPFLVVTLVPGAGLFLRVALLLPDLFGSLAVRPSVLVSHTPRVTSTRIPDRPLTAQLYLPGGSPPHPALVLTLGVHPVPPDDPSVTRLADGLARAGVAVLVIQSDDLVADRILASEVDNFAAAFAFARQQPEIDASRVGFFGFSAGASLAALAAADERIRDDLAVLGWLGGYGDTLTMMRAVVAESFVTVAPNDRIDHDDGASADLTAGRVTPWQPDPLTRVVFAKQLIDSLADEADRELLSRLFLATPDRGWERGALANAPPASLTESGQIVYRLLIADDPERVNALIGQLPPTVVARLSALSPIAVAAQIRAPVVIMHERGDQLVPFAESVRFANALLDHTTVELFLFDLFDHVRPNRSLAPVDLVVQVGRLHAAVTSVLRHLVVP